MRIPLKMNTDSSAQIHRPSGRSLDRASSLVADDRLTETPPHFRVATAYLQNLDYASKMTFKSLESVLDIHIALER